MYFVGKMGLGHVQLEAICSLVETGGRQRSRRRVDIPNRAVVSLPSGTQSWLAMGILSINGGFVGKMIILKWWSFQQALFDYLMVNLFSQNWVILGLWAEPPMFTGWPGFAGQCQTSRWYAPKKTVYSRGGHEKTRDVGIFRKWYGYGSKPWYPSTLK